MFEFPASPGYLHNENNAKSVTSVFQKEATSFSVADRVFLRFVCWNFAFEGDLSKAVLTME